MIIVENSNARYNIIYLESIIFHGCNVQCYCALASFLELGLDGSWITLIEPKPLSNDIFNGDPEVSPLFFQFNRKKKI